MVVDILLLFMKVAGIYNTTKALASGVVCNHVTSQLLVGGGQDLVKILYTRRPS